MAELFLASLEGAGGFTRPVVIKRVLPHLARRRDLRLMFVDEARIVLGLRHPNIVSVFELGQDDGELYLVMEYLEGESADAVVRRIRRSEAQVPIAVAGHIVAEAAQGLHAAHEHRDENGAHLGIVHRDVSPHNLFVSYEGGIKVIDFGIARAENRDSRTDTGTIKGKFAYMAPEQIEGQPVDRRADLWALGTILHELLTGRRLFYRGNQAETIRAVCKAEIEAPSKSRPDVPAVLDQITLRALSRDVTSRHATAAELRRDLLLALRELSPSVLPDEETAKTMQDVFADRVASKRVMLQRLASGVRPESVPAGDPDEPDELSIVVASEPSHLTVPSAPSQEAGPMAGSAPFGERPAAPPRRSLAAAGLGLGLLVAAGAGAAWNSSKNSAPPASTTGTHAPPPPPVTAAASIPATPIPDTTSIGAASTERPLPSPVRVNIDSTPHGAEVTLDGRSLGTTPLEVTEPYDETEVELALSRRGFRTLTERVTLDADLNLRFRLEREPRPRTSTPGTSPAKARRGFFRVE
jgi:serine/threonine protein kinase